MPPKPMDEKKGKRRFVLAEGYITASEDSLDLVRSKRINAAQAKPNLKAFREAHACGKKVRIVAEVIKP